MKQFIVETSRVNSLFSELGTGAITPLHFKKLIFMFLLELRSLFTTFKLEGKA